MTKAEFRAADDRIINEMKRIAHESPDTSTPDLHFKRDWAYGNAGLENEKITRQQVDQTIRDWPDSRIQIFSVSSLADLFF
jgi:hypothetical protein